MKFRYLGAMLKRVRQFKGVTPLIITLGEIAGLIAAIAFVFLVVYACKILASLTITVKELTKSIDVLTKDADAISKEVEVLVDQTNQLLGDINSKVQTIEPVFTTAAELSESVSDLNKAGREAVENVKVSTEKAAKATRVFKLGRTAFKLFNTIKNKRGKNDANVEK